MCVFHSRYVPPHLRRPGFNPEDKSFPPPVERSITNLQITQH